MWPFGAKVFFTWEGIMKLIEYVGIALSWFFGLFHKPEPLPLITQFCWKNIDFNQATARLTWEDGDVRFVYSDDRYWYYVGGIPVENPRLVSHLADRLLKERWRMEARQEARL